MLKFNFACMALFLGISASLIAQTVSLSGNVTTQNSDEPLSGAHIYLPGTNIGTASNNRGNFILSGLQEGDCEIIISFSGFCRVKKELNLKPGKNEV